MEDETAGWIALFACTGATLGLIGCIITALEADSVACLVALSGTAACTGIWAQCLQPYPLDAGSA